nr:MULTISPECIES: hypothetical protein [unclassified Gilliamella]
MTQPGNVLGFFGVSAVWRYWYVNFWIWDCAWYNSFRYGLHCSESMSAKYVGALVILFAG